MAVEIDQFATVPVRSVTIRLSTGDKVEVKVFTGQATQTGTGSFSGYKVD